MSNCLGLLVTVEGVETTEQYAFAVSEGCSSVQGYFISRAMPHEEFASFLAVWNGQTRPEDSRRPEICVAQG
jgi:EAL domain-containing protein (putative c-di-GMP-specific phosphodiesterase class I)